MTGIHSNTPIVGASNWDDLRESGWRHQFNMAVFTKATNQEKERVELLKKELGERNVASGNAFAGDEPRGIKDMVGIYVRRGRGS